MWAVVDTMEANVRKLIEMAEEGSYVTETEEEEPPPRVAPHGALVLNP